MSLVLLFFLDDSLLGLWWAGDSSSDEHEMDLFEFCLGHFGSEEKRSVRQQSDEMLQSGPAFKQNSLLHCIISLATIAHPSAGRWKDGTKKHLRFLWCHLLVTCVLNVFHSHYMWRRGACVVGDRRPRWSVHDVHRLSSHVVPCYPVRTRGFPWGIAAWTQRKRKPKGNHVTLAGDAQTTRLCLHLINKIFFCTFLKVWGEFASNTERILRHCCLFL